MSGIGTSLRAPVLILLNGLPGVGKSTVAAALAAARPGTTDLDIDLLRPILAEATAEPPGGAPGLAERARALGLERAAARLRAGWDVVVPQLVARADQVARFAAVADATGARFVHVVLTADPSTVAARARHDDAPHRSGLDAATLAGYAAGLGALLAEPGVVVIDVGRLGPKAVAERLAELVPTGGLRGPAAAPPGTVDPMTLAPTPARPFGAVLTAMVTPMTPGGDVDLDAAARLATRLVDDGNDGLVLSGTTGEAPTTHAPEKADLVRAVVDAVGDRAVVLSGAGSNDTAHAVRMAEQAADAGADGLLVVSPYYSRPTQEGLYRHFVTVADATELPVMLYDIPGRAGVRIARATFERLAAHPRIVANKDATGDVAAAITLQQATGLAWYSGDDALLLPFLSVGAAGIVSVSAHLVSRQFAEVVRRFDAGDHSGALDVFRTTVPVIEAMNGTGAQAVMVKAALEVLGVLSNRELRLPNVAATEDDVAQVRDALAAAGLLPVAAAGVGHADTKLP